VKLFILTWTSMVVGTSFVLAIFEILLERNRGWGSGLNPNGWGRKLLRASAIARICEKPYFTLYHVFMFAVIMPLVLVGEYLSSNVLYGVGGPSQKASGLLVHVFFVASVWLALVCFEDFLWFLMNWYYPQSLHALLFGDVWWHTKWVTLRYFKLPRFYFSCMGLSAIFFAAFLHFVRSVR
jgi:hypothetical protein